MPNIPELKIGSTTYKLKDTELQSAMENKADAIKWEDGLIRTGTGEYADSSQYARTVLKYPRGCFKYLVGWNINDIYSWVALFNNGTYYGYYHADHSSTLDSPDWNQFALVIYKKSSGYLSDILHFTSPFISDTRLIKQEALSDFSLGDESSIIDWQTGYYDPATGDRTNISETSRYRCSVKHYDRKFLSLLDGWNYSSSYDYISLYKDSTFVRIINNNSIIPETGWNNFTLTIYLRGNDDTVYYPFGPSVISFKTLIPDEGRLVKTLEVNTASGLIQAVQEAIDNESRKIEYNIIIASGSYELWPLLDKSQISGTGDQLYHRGLELPDKCNLIGRGNVTISCTIPESDNSSEHPYTHIVSTLNMHNTENLLENIRFVGNNVRYCIHDDSGFDDHYKQLTVRNCVFIHSGTSSDTYMPSPRCYGAGFTSGRKALFENCIFTASGNCAKELYVHTHTDEYSDTDLELIVESCAFISINKGAIDYQVVDNTSYCGRVTIRNCYFASGNYIDLRGKANSNTRVFGGGNSEVTINNGISAGVYLT